MIVTHNTPHVDLERSVRSLKAVSDDVIGFDDGSSDDTFVRLKNLGVSAVRSSKSSPMMLSVRRSMLYSEAERRGADWVICIDDDEEISPLLQRSLPEALFSLPGEYASVKCEFVNFWGDERHRRKERLGEFVAWRANRGYSYYPTIQKIMENPDRIEAWHATRPPPAAAMTNQAAHQVFWMPPDHALLHYANSSQERIEARRKWSAETGLSNRLNDEPTPDDVEEVPDPAPWA